MSFFWVKNFRQENRSNFTSENSSKRISTSASHLRQSFEMEASIGLELEEAILISNVLSSPNYMNLGYIKIKKGNIIKTVFDGGMDKNMIVWYGTATSY